MYRMQPAATVSRNRMQDIYEIHSVIGYDLEILKQLATNPPRGERKVVSRFQQVWYTAID
jgi:hypothetical protein